jgi:hypothetical protein
MGILEKYKNVAYIIGIEYKGKYIDQLSLNPSRFGMEIVIPPKLKGNDLKIDYTQLGIQLQYYISQNIDIICIPFNFEEKYGEGHANMLIYRPKLKIVEHFEPHGSYYGGEEISSSVSEYIQRAMINLWENQLKPWIGQVKYISTDIVCPISYGLQSISKDFGCLMWSLFVADFALSNPNITLSKLIPMILDISKKEKKYVRNIITGYMVKIEQLLSKILNREMKHGILIKNSTII